MAPLINADVLSGSSALTTRQMQYHDDVNVHPHPPDSHRQLDENSDSSKF